MSQDPSNQPRILLVDDDAAVLDGCRRTLRQVCAATCTTDPAEALRLLAAHEGFCLVIADMNMPRIDGIRLLAAARQSVPDVVRIMLTGATPHQTVVDAVNLGQVFRYLTKPCRPEDLCAAVTAAIRQHQLITAERELTGKTLLGAVRVLGEILAIVDPAAFARSQTRRGRIRSLLRSGGRTDTWEAEIASLLEPLPALLPCTGRQARETAAGLIAGIPRLEGVAALIAGTDDGRK